MIEFYIVLILAFLYIAFMGGVIGYLIGKYWKKKQRMDIDKVKSMLKQAKNAMLKYNATFEDRQNKSIQSNIGCRKRIK